MLGTIVNTCCIIAGSSIGSILHNGIDKKYQQVLFDAMGLASLALGCSTFTNSIGKCEYPILFILSLAIGGVIGTKIDINTLITKNTQHKNGINLAEGITTAALLFCVGTFSIVGPILSALNNDNTFLYTNATLDLVTSAIFAATYGWRIMITAIILFLWQSIFYCIALLTANSNIMQCGLINDLSAVGGVLIICSGLSILKLKDCKTLNLLPALLIPILWHAVRLLFDTTN